MTLDGRRGLYIDQADCPHVAILLSGSFTFCDLCGLLMDHARFGSDAWTCLICGRRGIHSHDVTVA